MIHNISFQDRNALSSSIPKQSTSGNQNNQTYSDNIRKRIFSISKISTCVNSRTKEESEEQRQKCHPTHNHGGLPRYQDSIGFNELIPAYTKRPLDYPMRKGSDKRSKMEEAMSEYNPTYNNKCVREKTAPTSTPIIHGSLKGCAMENLSTKF